MPPIRRRGVRRRRWPRRHPACPHEVPLHKSGAALAGPTAARHASDSTSRGGGERARPEVPGRQAGPEVDQGRTQFARDPRKPVSVASRGGTVRRLPVASRRRSRVSRVGRITSAPVGGHPSRQPEFASSEHVCQSRRDDYHTQKCEHPPIRPQVDGLAPHNVVACTTQLPTGPGSHISKDPTTYRAPITAAITTLIYPCGGCRGWRTARAMNAIERTAVIARPTKPPRNQESTRKNPAAGT